QSQVDHFLIWPAIPLQVIILIGLIVPLGHGPRPTAGNPEIANRPAPEGRRRRTLARALVLPLIGLAAAAILVWTDLPYAALYAGDRLAMAGNWQAAGGAFDRAQAADPGLRVYELQRARRLAELAATAEDAGLVRQA